MNYGKTICQSALFGCKQFRIPPAAALQRGSPRNCANRDATVANLPARGAQTALQGRTLVRPNYHILPSADAPRCVPTTTFVTIRIGRLAAFVTSFALSRHGVLPRLPSRRNSHGKEINGMSFCYFYRIFTYFSIFRNNKQAALQEPKGIFKRKTHFSDKSATR